MQPMMVVCILLLYGALLVRGSLLYLPGRGINSCLSFFSGDAVVVGGGEGGVYCILGILDVLFLGEIQP